MRFNPPPNWPTPPRGWEPGPQWTPDPGCPPPPPGWPLWLPTAPPAEAPPAAVAQTYPSVPPVHSPPPHAPVRRDRRPTTVQDSVVPTPSNALSRLAIAAIVCAVVVPPVGIALGMTARRQVRRTHEVGAGLAKAAIIVGSVVLALYLIAAIVVAVLALI